MGYMICALLLDSEIEANIFSADASSDQRPPYLQSVTVLTIKIGGRVVATSKLVFLRVWGGHSGESIMLCYVYIGDRKALVSIFNGIAHASKVPYIKNWLVF
jgi:hypothetical protein